MISPGGPWHEAIVFISRVRAGRKFVPPPFVDRATVIFTLPSETPQADFPKWQFPGFNENLPKSRNCRHRLSPSFPLSQYAPPTPPSHPKAEASRSSGLRSEELHCCSLRQQGNWPHIAYCVPTLQSKLILAFVLPVSPEEFERGKLPWRRFVTFLIFRQATPTLQI